MEKMDFSDRLAFYGLQTDDRHSRAGVKRVLDKYIGSALARFYGRIASVPALAHFFSGQGHMERAKSAQRDHWLDLFANGLGNAYFDRAANIGRVHARIGLKPQWYIGGYSLVAEDIIHAMVAPGLWRFVPGRRALAKRLSLFVKIALLDMDVALSTYFDATEDKTRQVVERLGEALAALAASDLTPQVRDLPVEYARVQSDFNAAVASLQEVLNSVIASVTAISSSSREIRSASDDLANRTEQQASALAETANAMQQITTIVTDTASNANSANEAVVSVHKQAEHGGEVVADAMVAMSAIETSSEQISQIIAVIDGIAFQTNLLALNAGVEAARAGEAGRGFAVVASEVRVLASRTTTAAKDIKELIGTSQADVSRGVERVGASGEVLSSILTRIGDLRGAIEEIACSARHQAENLSQINSAVSSMDQMTQQNAAMVEESTAAARSLAEEAEQLSRQVSRFQMPQYGAPPLAQPVRAASAAPARPARVVSSIGNLALKGDDDDWTEF